PGSVTDLWDSLLEEYDEIVHIPMSSGLSSSCETAQMLSQTYDGRVEVVNNQRISVTQRQSALDAVQLAAEGKTASEIREILERVKFESSIYITLETLKYLKKGGRITPAAAAIGTVLNLKPVLQIQGGKLDAYSKTRGKKAACKIMIEAIKKDLETRFADAWASNDVHMMLAYSGNPEEAEDWKAQLQAEFPGIDFVMNPLSLSVACHIGKGALAVACSVALKD
ncbi:MAG: DegV family protein, partial [Oscillospiraceae bacterium]